MIISNLGIGNLTKLILKEENSNFCYNDDLEDDEIKRAIQMSLSEAENKQKDQNLDLNYIEKLNLRNDTAIWQARVTESVYCKKYKLRVHKLNRIKKNVKNIQESFKKICKNDAG